MRMRRLWTASFRSRWILPGTGGQTLPQKSETCSMCGTVVGSTSTESVPSLEPRYMLKLVLHAINHVHFAIDTIFSMAGRGQEG